MDRRFFLAGASFAALTAATGVAWAQRRMRQHTATTRGDLNLVTANRRVGSNQVSISVRGSTRIVTGNGIPDHSVGSFPNAGNPHSIKAQRVRYQMPANPAPGQGGTVTNMKFGVGVNGIAFDPGAAEFYQGDRSNWQYEALGGAISLGLDANYGHVQPTGAYHYHGLPVGLMRGQGWSSSKASPLMGWAADGYPIYAMTAEVNGQVRTMKSSYKLRSGSRPGGRYPDGRYDGTFVNDYVYVKGAGDLDEHNGATVRTAEFPNGTYAYFLTQTFPVIPRSFRGSPDGSFRIGRG